MNFPGRRDDSYLRASPDDPRARHRPDVGPDEPFERLKPSSLLFPILVYVCAGLPVVHASAVLEPRNYPAIIVGHGGFARGVARRAPAASKRREPRRGVRQDPHPLGGHPVAPGDVHGDDVSQRVSRRERLDARVGDAPVAASARVDDRRRLVHQRAQRRVVQASHPARGGEEGIPDVGRHVQQRVTREVDELVDVPREKVGDDPLERLGPVRTTGAVVGHRTEPRGRRACDD